MDYERYSNCLKEMTRGKVPRYILKRWKRVWKVHTAIDSTEKLFPLRDPIDVVFGVIR